MSPAGVAQATALLVGVDFGKVRFDRELEELGLLAQSAGMRPVARMVCKRQAPDAALFVGSGKADEITQMALETGATEILFDQALSPAQQRNLERRTGLPVNDRTLLILDIFGQRARSHEGKLQVELARLQYLSTRLVRRWTHLERQRGGIGVRGGPGESQLEIDRRLVGDRIKRLKDKLKKLQRQRDTQRSGRARSDTFSVSIVGYTNAGKSTLFNRLTGATAYVADQLFATLDTTTRRIYVGDRAANHEYDHDDNYVSPKFNVALSDTVGFIRNLPHGLVAAFHATLTEALEADLLLHVVDASNPMRDQQIFEVNKVLAEIGAAATPQIIVYNKIDRLDMGQMSTPLGTVIRDEDDKIIEVRVSAKSGAGLDLLRDAMRERAKLAQSIKGDGLYRGEFTQNAEVGATAEAAHYANNADNNEHQDETILSDQAHHRAHLEVH